MIKEENTPASATPAILATLCCRPDGRLAIKNDKGEEVAVTAVRCFPWTLHDDFISLRDDKGKVTKKNDADHTVECEIWVENSEGKKNTTGAATVLLPAKAK